MHALSAGELPLLAHRAGVALAAIGRGVPRILCIAAVAAGILAIRSLVFEYNHGDRQVVLHLLDSLTS
jgi:hypothetical protein